MLRLNCFFQAKDGRLDDALAAAKELTAASLKQDGCIAYDVFAFGMSTPFSTMVVESRTS